MLPMVKVNTVPAGRLAVTALSISRMFVPESNITFDWEAVKVLEVNAGEEEVMNSAGEGSRGFQSGNVTLTLPFAGKALTVVKENYATAFDYPIL